MERREREREEEEEVHKERKKERKKQIQRDRDVQKSSCVQFLVLQELTWKMVLRFLQRPMLKEVLAIGR